MRQMQAALLGALLVTAACGDDGEQTDTPTATTDTPTPETPQAPAEAPIEPQVCTGETHTCVMKASGEVFCAGENLEGEIGDGTTEDRWTWSPVANLNDAKAIECGSDHTCALRRNGEVSCWGRNRNGELGAGNTDVQITPVAVSGLTGVAELSAGFRTTCARLGDGTVKCWGDGGSNILGRTSSDASPAPLAISGATDAAEISVGRAHACLRKNDGTVWCWGSNNSHQLGQAGDTTRQSALPVQVPGVTGATKVAVGGDHSCAITGGGFTCWGENENGQSSAAPTEEDVETPAVVAGLEGVTDMALGNKRTCTIMGGGAVKCWGYNNYTAGLLGIGPTEGVRDAAGPTDVTAVTGAQRIDTSDNHSCVVNGEGAVVCWGAAGGGRMGNDSPNSLQTAAAIVPSVSGMSAEAPTRETFAAAEGELELTPHFAVGSNHVCGVKEDGTVYCFGEGGDGRLGNGAERPNSSSEGSAVLGISDAVQVAAGLRQSCALRKNGSVVCWGRLGYRERNSYPTTIDLGEPVKHISVGGPADAMVLCGVHNDGTVTCVGYNNSGNLGRGSRGDSTMEPAKIEGLTDVEEVRVAIGSVCARQSSGKVFCWGSGRKGEIGNGADEGVYVPTEVSGLSDAVALGGGYYNHCAIKRRGQYVCWGDNDDGQLANGQTGREAFKNTPQTIRGISGALSASTTTDSMCIATRGGPRCWGANDFGQTGMGDSETDDVTSPVTYKLDEAEAVTALGDVIQMGCGSNFCCALHAEGGVSCAGSTPIGGSGGFFGMSNSRSTTPIVASGISYAIPSEEGGEE